MTVELDETMFRIVAPDETPSELAPYGSAAILEYEGSKYYCWIDNPNETPRVMRIDAETEIEATPEDTEFEVDTDEEEDEDDDEDEDGGTESDDEPADAELVELRRMTGLKN